MTEWWEQARRLDWCYDQTRRQKMRVVLLWWGLMILGLLGIWLSYVLNFSVIRIIADLVRG